MCANVRGIKIKDFHFFESLSLLVWAFLHAPFYPPENAKAKWDRNGGGTGPQICTILAHTRYTHYTHIYVREISLFPLQFSWLAGWLACCCQCFYLRECHSRSRIYHSISCDMARVCVCCAPVKTTSTTMYSCKYVEITLFHMCDALCAQILNSIRWCSCVQFTVCWASRINWTMYKVQCVHVHVKTLFNGLHF